MKGCFRNLCIDLGSKQAQPALELLLKMEKRSEKVRSARILTRSGYIHHSLSGGSMNSIFELLSRLPNLKSLSLDFHHYLPLEALACLRQSPRLRTLHIEHVQLTTTTTATSSQDSSTPTTTALLLPSELQELSLINCRGPTALERLLASGLPTTTTIRKLTISNCPIGRTVESTGTTLKVLARHASLQSLHLLDLTKLQDHHVQEFASELARASTSSLETLEFTSNILTSISGQALMEMMIQNTRIDNLKLHLDWEDSGKDVGDMLRINTTLKQLDLRLYGDDDNVRADARAIAEALGSGRNNTSLKRLRLCVEMEPTEADSQVILQEFETSLQTNETLRHLDVDDSIEDFPLPLSLQCLLSLNRSGARQLLRRHNSATQEQFVNALIRAQKDDDDLNTVYHILSNQPTLICNSRTTAIATTTTVVDEQQQRQRHTDSDKDQHTHKHYVYPSIIDGYYEQQYPVKPASNNNNQERLVAAPIIKLGRRRFFRNRGVVKSIFATSA